MDNYPIFIQSVAALDDVEQGDRAAIKAVEEALARGGIVRTALMGYLTHEQCIRLLQEFTEVKAVAAVKLMRALFEGADSQPALEVMGEASKTAEGAILRSSGLVVIGL